MNPEDFKYEDLEKMCKIADEMRMHLRNFARLGKEMSQVLEPLPALHLLFNLKCAPVLDLVTGFKEFYSDVHATIAAAKADVNSAQKKDSE